MGKGAVLFPGQGAHSVGMGRDVYLHSPSARSIFDRADEVLGFKLSEIVFDGPEEKLKETDVQQPAILTTSIAVVEAARELGWDGRAAATAGLSLGEYSALVFAGAISFEDGVSLVHKRGTYMREAGLENPGTMASVIGLDVLAVDAIVEEASKSGLVTVANLNCPGQVVLSGEVAGVEAAAELAASAGAIKVSVLKVDGAFHSPLMRPAADRLAKELEKTHITTPEIPVVANRTAGFATGGGADEIRRLLLEQLTSPVLWEKSIRMLLAAGVDNYVEIGPGRVLTGLVRRIGRKIPMSPVGDMETAGRLARGEFCV